MKLNHLFALSVALLSLRTTARAQNENLASIFTNAGAIPTIGLVPERRTSIIYIQCHGLGYGDLSCYGQTNFQTPNLDRLAAQGIRFTNFRPGGTNFTDSLAALVSGKKSGGRNAPTIAGYLQQAGFHTGLIGEWTLGAKPWTQGFEEFAGFLGEDEGRDYFAGGIWRFAPHGWMTESNTLEDFNRKEVIYENTGGKKTIYLPELLANAMCSYVRINQPDQFNTYKPFFLLVDFPAPRSASAGADEFPVPSDAPFSDQPWPQTAKDRASLITRLDGSIGKLFDQFRQLGMSNNVAVFFSSSEAPEKFKNAGLNFLSPNGTPASSGRGAPAPLPMIVRWPEQIPAGQVSSFKWTGVDFMRTALEMSSMKPVNEIEGISVLPVLRGQKGLDVDSPAKPEGTM